jgi:hypothetical protein
MKRQESAKKVARELEVDFDENGRIVTPAIRRLRTRNNSVSSTLLIPVAPVSVINSNQEPVVAPAEVTTGENTSPVDEMVATENHALAPPPLNSSYNSGSSSDYRNSGLNRERMIAMEMLSRITLQTAGRVILAESSIRTAARIPSNWQWR